jgi:hypoxanthine phosphoribosyltransferase
VTSDEHEVLTYEQFGVATRDLADTGKTLEHVRAFCADHVADARIAVIYEKARSVVEPDYVWRKTDRWIDFPWSVLSPVTRRGRGRES